jgi:hypothetical protein
MSKAAELANLIGNINAGGGGVNRNVIINGAMNVAQRGDVTGKTAASYGGPDRFAVGITSHGTYAVSQSSTVPSGKGFANSYKLDCTTADTSVGSNAEVTIQHRFEGQNLQTLRKGTSEAKPITATFYCRSNLTGTFTLEFFDNDNSRQCSKNFTISSADTWEFKSITFPADTTGTFGNDNLQSAVLVWWLAAGSDFTSGTQNTSAFASNTSANRVSSSIVNMSSSTDNEFLLTGVQLEVGQNPTEFEHEPFDVTLRKCYRYFQKQSYISGTYVNVCYAYDTGSSRAVQYYAPKLKNPTITTSGTLSVYHSAGDIDVPTNQYHDLGLESCRLTVTLSGESTTAGYAMATYTTTAYDILIDAEL